MMTAIRQTAAGQSAAQNIGNHPQTKTNNFMVKEQTLKPQNTKIQSKQVSIFDSVSNKNKTPAGSKPSTRAANPSAAAGSTS